MRITALAVAMLFACGVARTTLAQAPASAKNLGTQAQSQQSPTGPSLIQRRMATQAACVAQQQPAEQQAVMFVPQAAAGQQVVMLVPQQLPDGQQAIFLMPQQAAGSDIQLVGYPQMAGGYPCGPNCPQGYGGGAAGFGSAAGYGGYGYSHPGGPFSGGHYGAFGGAHRTPGYPHHHLHREYVGPQGPPSAQVAYPYYTVRGPRDFLMDNPPSIGR